MLRVIVEDLGDIVTLNCVGRLVRGDETAILCAAAQRGGRNLVLDLGQVDAIDAAGVGALIALQAAGIYLKLRNPTKSVREVLRLTQVESVFEIDADPSGETTIPADVNHDSSAATLPVPAVVNG
ncbi:MAG TPA: STAS domain-containing protein [Terriglobales bacterium]|nr:STAS domain-containing protein [Terriglobales bacterium]